MAEGGEDKDSKTEEPTSKRLEEARKRGQIPFSREVGSFLILFVLAVTIAWYAPRMALRTRDILTPYLANAYDYPVDMAGVGTIFYRLTFQSLGLVIGPLLAAAVVTVAASVLQNGFNLSAEPLMPKWEKISIAKGISRMFSMRSLVEFLKGLCKIGIVGTVAWIAVSGQLGHVKQMVDDDLIAILLFLLKLSVKLMIGVCIAMFFIALIDLIYQRLSYIKNLRMSKQELKEEYKQQEGDPVIKQRLRQIRMERAKKRMMAEVPGADVVITNPTHFAVALKYESTDMQAPKVVAKGQDYIALSIRRIAEENNVPIVENPPLARALFDNVEIDQEIPVQHYKAVAEVISYVYKLKGRAGRK